MKNFFKKAKNDLKDHLRPQSPQSVVSSQAQSLRSSTELAVSQAPNQDVSIIPLTTVPVSQPAIGPVSSAKSSTAPDDLPLQTPHPAAPIRVLESTSQTGNTIEVALAGLSAFDKLRDAMKEDDTNLFAPLQVALTDLVRLGRSLEARCSSSSAFPYILTR